MTNLNKTITAIQNNFLVINKEENINTSSNLAEVATVVSNINYNGFMPSMEVFDVLKTMSREELNSFWENLEPAFKEVTGEKYNISDFVVYKNFPEEVLSMSRSEYVVKQILIYFGVKYDHLREEEDTREDLTEKVEYKVLNLANQEVFEEIFISLMNRSNAWNDNQTFQAETLMCEFSQNLDIDKFKFKENAMSLSKLALDKNIPIFAKNATDVLRLAFAWSEIEFSTPVKKVRFKAFKRPERKFLLSMLENSKTLEHDVSMKRNLWKKLFGRLNPSDYKFKRVQSVYDSLYNKKIKGLESDFKLYLSQKDPRAMTEALKLSSGFYLRNIHQLYAVFGIMAFELFSKNMDKLSVSQLLKLSKYLETENDKKVRIVAPKGSWSKLQLIENNKVKFKSEDIEFLTSKISDKIDEKLSPLFPNGIVLSKQTKRVKMPTNDLRIDLYGRGTEFDIPENIKAVRLASYWNNGERMNHWFDNGVNFFNENYKSVGACCWNRGFQGSLFSGDPLPSNDKEGQGAQLIDLNLEELEEKGVKYAIWSILSFNSKPFSQAPAVFGAMQFCEESQKGELFEPSRCQMMFDIKDNSLTKYVAYVDVKNRKVIFLDANMPANVTSASSNAQRLEEQFPAFLEYIDSQPSIYDLFSHIKNRMEIDESNFLEPFEINFDQHYIGYSDNKVLFESDLENKQKAYLFKHTNENNVFERINILDYLPIV